MTELDSATFDAVSGGNIFLQAITVARLIVDGCDAFGRGINAMGGTLSNYYGNEATLEIVAAGNMGA